MIILGINAFHGDSSASLVMDGKLVCALEEERLRRVKHWAGFPSRSIEWCLEYAGVEIADVDSIAISRNPRAHIHKKIFRLLTRLPRWKFIKDRLSNVSKVRDVKTLLAEALGVERGKIRGEIQNVEHHRAHIGSAFFVSPFEEAACVTIDGFGDFLSSMVATGRGNAVEVDSWVEFPHSLGIFYTAFTQYLGFWNYGDEYKVMGLSALGEPSFMEEMRKIVKTTDQGLFAIDTSYFKHDTEGVEMVWDNDRPQIGQIFSDRLIDLLGPPRKEGEEISDRHRDLAASMQACYEEAYFHILNSVYQKTGLDKVVLAGGCIQNSLANGKLWEKTPFQDIYIPPSAHDGGTAVGAAYWVWNQVEKREREFVMDHPFWGPEFSEGEIEQALREREVKFEKLDDGEITQKTAQNLTEGKVIGWYQGRSEWGPRALGNRSILADVRRSDMKEIINDKIKLREPFRPFAPSVLAEKMGEWFQESRPVPFMEKVYSIAPEKKSEIPAVCHFDGTGRPQSVSSDFNPRYYQMIKAFYDLTEVPMVLNTSFNENEPIVNTPQEAVDCFLRTKMDALVMEGFWAEK